jgi:hypothetical protein
MITFFVVLGFIVLISINILLLYLLKRFVGRLLEAEDILNEVGDIADSLSEFCETLKKRDLIYWSPEAQRFHKMVVKLAKPLEKISKLDGKSVKNG